MGFFPCAEVPVSHTEVPSGDARKVPFLSVARGDGTPVKHCGTAVAQFRVVDGVPVDVRVEVWWGK